MSDFGTELARLMTARGVGVRELARMVPCNPGHISNLRSGKARPSRELAEALDERLDGGRDTARSGPRPRAEQAPAGPRPGRRRHRRRDRRPGSGSDRLKLVRSAAARLSGWSWPWMIWPRPTRVFRSAVLLVRVRGYLGHVTRLLDAKTTLAEHRRLLVVGGWLSLLAAATLIDLHRDHVAAAHLRTAARLARVTEHAEIAAWCLETQAWQVLTAGACPGGQRTFLRPRSGSPRSPEARSSRRPRRRVAPGPGSATPARPAPRLIASRRWSHRCRCPTGPSTTTGMTRPRRSSTSPPRCPGWGTRPPRASPARCSPRSKHPSSGPGLGARPWPGSIWPWR